MQAGFVVNNQSVKYVDEYVHLGHVISSDLDDARDTEQINNVLCLFGKLNLVIKIELLISYCYGLYGSVIYNLTNTNVQKVCTSWRAWLRKVRSLPAMDNFAEYYLVENRNRWQHRFAPCATELRPRPDALISIIHIVTSLPY